MSNFPSIKLKQLCTVTSSKRIFSKEYSIDGIPFYRSKEIIAKSLGVFNNENTLYISKARFQEIKRQFGAPINGDLLISSVGNRSGIPYVVESDGDFYFKDGNLIWLKKFNGLDSKYLYYWINSKIGQNTLNSIMIGSAQKALTINGIGNLEIPLPDFSIQQKIASILSSLDDKIELNNKMNQTLEKMAQTIFKEWFEEFNFPDAEGKLYKINGGAMHSSELGEIPDGWKIKDLIDISEIISKGTTARTKDIKDLTPCIQFLKVKDIDNNGTIKLQSLEKIPKEVHEKQLKRSILKVDDILFSIAGTIGRVSIIPNNLDNSNCNQTIAFIRLKDNAMLNRYVYQWIKTSIVQNEINSSIVQGVQANVSLTTLGKLRIILPNDEIINKFNNLIIPISEQIKQNQQQTQTLRKLRDTLLPKLMNGEVAV